MPWLLANRWALYAAGIIAVILAAWAWLGIHDRGIRIAQEAVDAAKSAQALADQRAEQKAHDEAENARVGKAIENYELQLSVPNPLTVNLGERLHYYSLRSCGLPQAAANTQGTGSPPGESSSPSEVERAVEALGHASANDAAQVEGLRATWPK